MYFCYISHEATSSLATWLLSSLLQTTGSISPIKGSRPANIYSSTLHIHIIKDKRHGGEPCQIHSAFMHMVIKSKQANQESIPGIHSFTGKRKICWYKALKAQKTSTGCSQVPPHYVGTDYVWQSCTISTVSFRLPAGIRMGHVHLLWSNKRTLRSYGCFTLLCQKSGVNTWSETLKHLVRKR